MYIHIQQLVILQRLYQIKSNVFLNYGIDNPLLYMCNIYTLK